MGAPACGRRRRRRWRPPLLPASPGLLRCCLHPRAPVPPPAPLEAGVTARRRSPQREGARSQASSELLQSFVVPGALLVSLEGGTEIAPSALPCAAGPCLLGTASASGQKACTEGGSLWVTCTWLLIGFCLASVTASCHVSVCRQTRAARADAGGCDGVALLPLDRVGQFVSGGFCGQAWFWCRLASWVDGEAVPLDPKSSGIGCLFKPEASLVRCHCPFLPGMHLGDSLLERKIVHHLPKPGFSTLSLPNTLGDVTAGLSILCSQEHVLVLCP